MSASLVAGDNICNFLQTNHHGMAPDSNVTKLLQTPDTLVMLGPGTNHRPASLFNFSLLTSSNLVFTFPTSQENSLTGDSS